MKITLPEIVGVIIVLAVLGVLFGAIKVPGFNVGTQTTTVSSNGQPVVSNSGQAMQCSTLSYAPALDFALYWNDFTKPTASSAFTQTQVATSFSVYNPVVSKGAAALTGTSSATVYNAFSTTCGATLWLVGGDNSNYFENLTAIQVVNGTQYTAETLYRIGTATSLASNSPYNTGTTTANIIGVGAGGSANLYESIEANNYYIGNPAGFVVVYTYNSLGETPTITGGTRYYGTLPGITYKTGQNAAVAYQFPQCHYTQYCFPNGVSSSFGTFTVQIQTTSSYSAVPNDIVSQTIFPISSYLDGNGVWHPNVIATFSGTAVVAGTDRKSVV